MNRRNVLIIVIVLVVTGIAGGYFYFKQTPDVVQQTPDVSVTAQELIAAFEQDSLAARKKFVDKIVEVTGTVKNVDTSGAVVLGEDGSASGVVIGLDRRYLSDYKKLTEGTKAVLQGVCTGYTAAGSADPADLLASLGTTVQLRSAGVKSSRENP